MEIVLGEGVVVGAPIVRFIAKLRLSVVARIEEAEETRGEDTIELDDVTGEMGLDQVVINAARTKIGEELNLIDKDRFELACKRFLAGVSS